MSTDIQGQGNNANMHGHMHQAGHQPIDGESAVPSGTEGNVQGKEGKKHVLQNDTLETANNSATVGQKENTQQQAAQGFRYATLPQSQIDNLQTGSPVLVKQNTPPPAAPPGGEHGTGNEFMTGIYMVGINEALTKFTDVMKEQTAQGYRSGCLTSLQELATGNDMAEAEIKAGEATATSEYIQAGISAGQAVLSAASIAPIVVSGAQAQKTYNQTLEAKKMERDAAKNADTKMKESDSTVTKADERIKDNQIKLMNLQKERKELEAEKAALDAKKEDVQSSQLKNDEEMFAENQKSAEIEAKIAQNQKKIESKEAKIKEDKAILEDPQHLKSHQRILKSQQRAALKEAEVKEYEAGKLHTLSTMRQNSSVMLYWNAGQGVAHAALEMGNHIAKGEEATITANWRAQIHIRSSEQKIFEQASNTDFKSAADAQALIDSITQLRSKLFDQEQQSMHWV